MCRVKLLRLFLWLPILALSVLGFLVVGVAMAQETQPVPITDDQVNVIAKQLYCPVCENVPLDVCPTQACEQWRQLIREKLTQGWSEGQIKDYFVAQYGDRVLATPPAQGLNWLVYIIPPLAILAGAFILYRAFNVWKAPPPAEAYKDLLTESSTDEYVSRIEEELRRR